MSLKKILNNWIEEKGEVTYNELRKYVDELGYKLANAERQLRPSASPNIQGYDKYGNKAKIGNSNAIVKYRWIGAEKAEELYEEYYKLID